MVDVKTELVPFRMILAKKQPVEMTVEVENNSNKAQRLTLELALDDHLSFDKGGRGSTIVKRFDAMQPGEHFREYFNIYPRPNVEEGDHTITISIFEHYNNDYSYIQGRKVKELTLRVE